MEEFSRLKQLTFFSNNHVRKQNGHVIVMPHNPDRTGNNFGCLRIIGIERIGEHLRPMLNNVDWKQLSASRQELFVIAIFSELNSNLWGDNYVMGPKVMKVISKTPQLFQLKGYGADLMGFSFEDYGISIHKEREKDQIEKIILHMYDRNIDIEYYCDTSQSTFLSYI